MVAGLWHARSHGLKELEAVLGEGGVAETWVVVRPGRSTRVSYHRQGCRSVSTA